MGNAYLRSVINNDKIWFEILKEFMVENAKVLRIPEIFLTKSIKKLAKIYWYFAQQYFYTPYQPKLEYYQTDSEFLFSMERCQR